MRVKPFDHIRWVFFDLGNTLMDESRARRSLLTQITRRLRKEGASVSPLQLEQRLAAAFTRFTPDPWEHMLTEILHDSSASRQILEELPYPSQLERPYPSARPLVSALADAGFLLGVIANQSVGAEERLASLGLSRYFSICLSSAELGISKPDARIFQMAEGMAQSSGDSLLMIGDRIDNDIRPTRQRGWTTIRIRKGPARGQQPRDSLDQAHASYRNLVSVANFFNLTI